MPPFRLLDLSQFENKTYHVFRCSSSDYERRFREDMSDWRITIKEINLKHVQVDEEGLWHENCAFLSYVSYPDLETRQLCLPANDNDDFRLYWWFFRTKEHDYYFDLTVPAAAPGLSPE